MAKDRMDGSRNNVQYKSGTSTINGPSQMDTNQKSSSRVKVDFNQEEDPYGSAGVMEEHTMSAQKPRLSGEPGIQGQQSRQEIISPGLDEPVQEMKQMEIQFNTPS